MIPRKKLPAPKPEELPTIEESLESIQERFPRSTRKWDLKNFPKIDYGEELEENDFLTAWPGGYERLGSYVP